MSYHIIHVLTPQSRLSVDRGCLVCEAPEQNPRRAPLADILALIVAARGAIFTSDSLASLLQHDCVILHCDKSFRPIGKTVGLSRVVHNGIFEKQISRDTAFNNALWQIILRAKVTNQAAVLDYLQADHRLHEYLDNNQLDEGNTARHYWKHYFRAFGRTGPERRERQNAEHPVNQMLNYGYAVMGAILHRSIIIHGLNPTLGVHHKYRFRSDPLVYDLMEPIRPFCDYLFLEYYRAYGAKDISEWTKQSCRSITEYRVQAGPRHKLKILNALDQYVSSVADCYYHNDPQRCYIPALPEPPDTVQSAV